VRQNWNQLITELIGWQKLGVEDTDANKALI